MSTTTPLDPPTSPVPAAPARPVRPRLRLVDILILAAWCGLAAGLLEVAARVVGKTFFSTNRFYMMTKHFFWLIPLTNLAFFAALGIFLAILGAVFPRSGRWLAPRLIAFLAIAPVLILLVPSIYQVAWIILALGVSLRLSPYLEHHAGTLRRRLLVSFPGLLAVELLLAGWILGGIWLAGWRESTRPLPPGQPPNVILITMDTVRADHLSLHGYSRPTSPVLEALARAGIRFDAARAAGSWTLPSHASLFTGRWPHELGVTWNRSLDRRFPTLAEYLGSRGYATAGFAGNTLYCSYDDGLDRGFAHFEDYPLVYLIPFRTAWLFDHLVGMLTDAGMILGRSFNVGPLRPMHESWLSPLVVQEPRKDAGMINASFLNWLARRQQPDRPFFAFLNYYDAHAPYVLPRGGGYRFGLVPRRAIDFIFLSEYWQNIDKLKVSKPFRELARDSYDNCIAYLDEQIGALIRELQRQHVLDHTWLIVTADHGEGMGEHDLFDHGESVYSQEIHVPLVIVPPAGQRAAHVVRETVSLRDLPATILDLIGLAEGSNLAGHSLAPLWQGHAGAPTAETARPVLSELPAPNPYNPNNGRSPANRGPLVALGEGDFVYIRNQKDGTEELYNERADPQEEHDLSRDQTSRSVLEKLRGRLDALLPSAASRVPIPTANR